MFVKSASKYVFHIKGTDIEDGKREGEGGSSGSNEKINGSTTSNLSSYSSEIRGLCLMK